MSEEILITVGLEDNVTKELDKLEKDVIDSTKETQKEINDTVKDGSKDRLKTEKEAQKKLLDEIKKAYEEQKRIIDKAYKDSVTNAKGNRDKEIEIEKDYNKRLQKLSKERSIAITRAKTEGVVDKSGLESIKSLGFSKGELKDTILSKTGLSSIATSGALMATGIGAAVVGATKLVDVIGSGIKANEQFSKGVSEVLTLLGTSGKQYEDTFKTGLTTISKQTGQGVETLTKGLYDLISAGVPASDALKTLEVASKTAIAGVTDTSVAVDGLTSVINAYGDSFDNAQKYSDIFFATVKNGKTTMAELASEVGKVAPAANILGVSFDQVSAAMAGLTLSGVKTVNASTALNSLFTQLAKKDVQESFKKLGIEVLNSEGKITDLNKVIKEFASKGLTATDIGEIIPDIEGRRALSILQNMSQQGGKLDAIFNDIKNSTGQMGTAFNTMSNTSAMRSAQLEQQWEATSRAIGDAFQGVVDSGKEGIISLFELFDNYDEKAKKTFAESDYLKQQSQQVDQLGQSYINSLNSISQLEAQLQQLKATGQDTSSVEAQLATENDNLNNAMTQLRNVAPEVAMEIANSGKSAELASASVDKAVQSYNALAKAKEQEAAFTAYEGFQEQTETYLESQAKYVQATQERQRLEAEEPKNIKAIMEARSAEATASTKALETQGKWESSYQKIASNTDVLKISLDDVNKTVQENIKSYTESANTLDTIGGYASTASKGLSALFSFIPPVSAGFYGIGEAVDAVTSKTPGMEKLADYVKIIASQNKVQIDVTNAEKNLTDINEKLKTATGEQKTKLEVDKGNAEKVLADLRKQIEELKKSANIQMNIVTKQTTPAKTEKKSKGGVVGYSEGGLIKKENLLQGKQEDGYAINTDTGEPIALKDGEFVINKEAVKKYGIANLDKINKQKLKNGGIVGLQKGGGVTSNTTDLNVNTITANELDSETLNSEQSNLSKEFQDALKTEVNDKTAKKLGGIFDKFIGKFSKSGKETADGIKQSTDTVFKNQDELDFRREKSLQAQDKEFENRYNAEMDLIKQREELEETLLKKRESFNDQFLNPFEKELKSIYKNYDDLTEKYGSLLFTDSDLRNRLEDQRKAEITLLITQFTNKIESGLRDLNKTLRTSFGRTENEIIQWTNNATKQINDIATQIMDLSKGQGMMLTKEVSALSREKLVEQLTGESVYLTGAITKDKSKDLQTASDVDIAYREGKQGSLTDKQFKDIEKRTKDASLNVMATWISSFESGLEKGKTEKTIFNYTKGINDDFIQVFKELGYDDELASELQSILKATFEDPAFDFLSKLEQGTKISNELLLEFNKRIDEQVSASGKVKDKLLEQTRDLFNVGTGIEAKKIETKNIKGTTSTEILEGYGVYTQLEEEVRNSKNNLIAVFDTVTATELDNLTNELRKNNKDFDEQIKGIEKSEGLSLEDKTDLIKSAVSSQVDAIKLNKTTIDRLQSDLINTLGEERANLILETRVFGVEDVQKFTNDATKFLAETGYVFSSFSELSKKEQKAIVKQLKETSFFKGDALLQQIEKSETDNTQKREAIGKLFDIAQGYIKSSAAELGRLINSYTETVTALSYNIDQTIEDFRNTFEKQSEFITSLNNVIASSNKTILGYLVSLDRLSEQYDESTVQLERVQSEIEGRRKRLAKTKDNTEKQKLQTEINELENQANNLSKFINEYQILSDKTTKFIQMQSTQLQKTVDKHFNELQKSLSDNQIFDFFENTFNPFFKDLLKINSEVQKQIDKVRSQAELEIKNTTDEANKTIDDVLVNEFKGVKDAGFEARKKEILAQRDKTIDNINKRTDEIEKLNIENGKKVFQQTADRINKSSSLFANTISKKINETFGIDTEDAFGFTKIATAFKGVADIQNEIGTSLSELEEFRKIKTKGIELTGDTKKDEEIKKRADELVKKYGSMSEDEIKKAIETYKTQLSNLALPFVTAITGSITSLANGVSNAIGNLSSIANESSQRFVDSISKNIFLISSIAKQGSDILGSIGESFAKSDNKFLKGLGGAISDIAGPIGGIAGAISAVAGIIGDIISGGEKAKKEYEKFLFEKETERINKLVEKQQQIQENINNILENRRIILDLINTLFDNTFVGQQMQLEETVSQYNETLSFLSDGSLLPKLDENKYKSFFNQIEMNYNNLKDKLKATGGLVDDPYISGTGQKDYQDLYKTYENIKNEIDSIEQKNNALNQQRLSYLNEENMLREKASGNMNRYNELQQNWWNRLVGVGNDYKNQAEYEISMADSAASRANSYQELINANNQQKQQYIDQLKALGDINQILIGMVNMSMQKMEFDKLSGELAKQGVGTETEFFNIKANFLNQSIKQLREMGVSENQLMELEKQRIDYTNQAIIANEKDLEIQARLNKEDLNSIAYKEKLLALEKANLEELRKQYGTTLDNENGVQAILDQKLKIVDLERDIEGSQEKQAAMRDAELKRLYKERQELQRKRDLTDEDLQKQAENRQLIVERLGKLGFTEEEINKEIAGLKVRSYDTGGYIDKDQLAMVHKGEEVLNVNDRQDLIKSFSKMSSIVNNYDDKAVVYLTINANNISNAKDVPNEIEKYFRQNGVSIKNMR